MTFVARPHILRWCLFLLLIVVGAAGREVRAQDTPQPTVQIEESARTATGAIVTFAFQWDTPLREMADSAGIGIWNHDRLDVLSGGLLMASHRLDLPALAFPDVQVVSRSFDETPVRIELPESDPWQGRPDVWASGLGTLRKQSVVNIVTMPYRLDAESGVLRRLNRLTVAVTFGAAEASVPVRASKGRASESVLATGTLFRISIAEDGVYRITRSLLTSLGQNPDQIDPNAIQLFGNGGRPLPARVGDERTDDLEELPAVRSGGGDGRFDASDEVLFYASAPRGWTWSAAGMEHFVHPFSNDNAVVLKIGSGGRRLEQLVDPGTATAPMLTTTQGRYVVDLEEAIWSREHPSGHDWLSNRIRPGIDRTIFNNLQLPGMQAGTLLYEARVAIASNPRATVAMLSDGVTLGQRTAPTAIGGLSQYPVAYPATMSFVQQVVAGQPLNLSMRLLNQANDPEAALDWVRIVYERTLVAQSGWIQAMTRPNTASPQRLQMTGFGSTPRVWDVTDGRLQHTYFVEAGGGGHVVHIPMQGDGAKPREVVAFTPDAVRAVAVERVRSLPNQNLHGVTNFPDLVIVTADPFMNAASRLAAHRRSQGLDVLVVTQEQVFNEFSGSVPDMRAVRDFMAFLYGRTPDPDQFPHYLLLFGDGHYDFRGISGYQNALSNHVFPYETEESLSTTSSFTSDDYFGLLDPEEGEWRYTGEFDKSTERVDVGIGRLPVQTAADAENVVDKLLGYDDPSSFGTWRTTYTAVADDGPTGLSGQQDDRDLHLANVDQVVELLTQEIYPSVNVKKIYGETYERVFLNGFRLPGARRDILDTIERGTLVLNYSGHGGPDGLAQESIFSRDDAAQLTNGDRLPIVITATCSFGWWDLEEDQSGAEVMLLNPDGGAIALFTSVRLAFTSTSINSLNAGLNRALNEEMFRRDGTQPRRLGDIMRETKNTGVGLEGNSRKFNLLGDPSMQFGLPSGQAVVETLNGSDLQNQQGQMKALDKVRIAGAVRDPSGQVDASFDGLINVSVFDAERQIPIKQQWANPRPWFRQREDLLWRGDVRASAGRWEAEFVVPKDIGYTNQPGRISVYAQDGAVQAIGWSERFLVGGTSDSPPDDNEGPRIDLFLNDSTFVAGSTVEPDPELIVRLFDASGINTVGAGVGHEILLAIDGDEAGATDIGSAFVSAPDSYQEGEIRWPLSDLSTGPHSLSVRAWDVLNNSNTAELSFSIANDEVLNVFNVYNYPNPMNRETRFIFEHNQPSGTPAEVQIRIYTLSGRPIRTILSDEALPEGVLGSGPLVVHWDGKDDDLDRPATGIYLYRIRVAIDRASGDRQVSEHVEKLAIIR
ncbi:MAG: type IX secretion system sortase PorU [Bacteroidetes bacterium]|nr:type IX secretion system sortase PorU [Bacteroidota bacterium]